LGGSFVYVGIGRIVVCSGMIPLVILVLLAVGTLFCGMAFCGVGWLVIVASGGGFPSYG